MRKLKFIPIIVGLPLFLVSCVVVTTHRTTGNPIGTKVGYVKSKNLGNTDFGIGAAAQQGKITKIGSVDVYYFSNGKIAVKVTGE